MKKLARSLVGAALMAAATSASAVILPTGVWTPLPGTTVALQPELEGVALEDELQAFSFATDGGTVSGAVQSRVVRSTVDGTLDFYWRILTDASSTVPLVTFRLGNFFSPSYDANWRIDGLGDTAPSQAMLFGGGGGKINFRFDAGGPGTGILPGGESYFLMLDTSYTAYARSAIYDLTGRDGISDLFTTFAPIPEPASAALFALGMAGLALTRRRKA